MDSSAENGGDASGRERDELAAALEVLDRSGVDASLITVLLDVQDAVGYLPAHVMSEVARRLGVSNTRVYSVASFYNQFRFTHPGRRRIQVCMGTACHVKRGQVVLDSFERKLDIQEGQVTDDREYGLERVNCVGCCALAPVVVVDDEMIGHMSPTKVDGMVMAFERERAEREDG
jgi:NADH-quinone oxidoreductase subunit E